MRWILRLSFILIVVALGVEPSFGQDREERLRRRAERKTEKELKRIEKRYKKDSSRVARRIERRFKEETDVEGRIRRATLDLREEYRIDKVEELRNELLRSQELKETTTGEISMISDSVSNLKDGIPDRSRIDQLVENEVTRIDQVSELGEMEDLAGATTEELTAPVDAATSFRNNIEELAQRRQNIDERISGLAQEKLSDITQGTLQRKSPVQKLKRKYSSVQSSANLDEAKKINSLQDVPFRHRIIFDWNFQFFAGSPQKLDISPTLGYMMNRRWIVGAGGTFRATIAEWDTKALAVRQENVYGYNMYSEYRMIRSFFVHGEYERLNTELFNLDDEPIGRAWIPGLYLGIGKNTSITKFLAGRVLVLYNFKHSPDSPYQGKWQIRFGFRMKIPEGKRE